MRSKRLSLRNAENELNMGVVILILIIAALLTVMVATGMGPVSVSPETTARILLSKIPGIGRSIVPNWKPVEQNIVLVLRLPRVCLGLVVGASLAICGVTMQALVRNNLAVPSSWACLLARRHLRRWECCSECSLFWEHTPFPSAHLSVPLSQSSLSMSCLVFGDALTLHNCFCPVLRFP